ncbi:MAG: DUF6169 family protein [Breznakibacter sp.]
MESNSFSPYEIERIGSYYQFTTKHGLVYRASFIDRPAENIQNYNCTGILEFSFEKSDELKMAHDPLIAYTITNLLSKIFDNNPFHVIIFNCYDGDNKSKARNRLFSIWFNKYAKHFFSKIDRQIEFYEDTFYFSCIHSTSCSKGQIETLINSNISELISFKNSDSEENAL